MKKKPSHFLNFPQQWIKYTPDNLTTPDDWEAFFEQLAFLKTLANIQPADFHSQEEWEYFFDSLKNLKKEADKKNSLALKSAYYKTMRRFTSKIPTPPTRPAAAGFFKTSEEWSDFYTHLSLLKEVISINPENLNSNTDWINFFEKISLLNSSCFNTGSAVLKKAYLQTVRKIYPAYEMPSQAQTTSLNRIKTVWDNLKASPDFEQELKKYTLGNNNEKRKAIKCLTKQITHACKPFFNFKNLRVVFYDNNTVHKDGFDNFHGYTTSFCSKNEPNKFYMNVDDKRLKKTSAAEMVGLIFHELTHLMQYTLMDKKTVRQKNYFDPHFASVLKVFYPVYENTSSLKKLNMEINASNAAVSPDSQADTLAYYNNPMEQDAYFSGDIISILTQNLLIGKGLGKENHVYDYRLAARFHFPFKSNREVLSVFNEKENVYPPKNFPAMDKKAFFSLLNKVKESSL